MWLRKQHFFEVVISVVFESPFVDDHWSTALVEQKEHKAQGGLPKPNVVSGGERTSACLSSSLPGPGFGSPSGPGEPRCEAGGRSRCLPLALHLDPRRLSVPRQNMNKSKSKREKENAMNRLTHCREGVILVIQGAIQINYTPGTI